MARLQRQESNLDSLRGWDFNYGLFYEITNKAFAMKLNVIQDGRILEVNQIATVAVRTVILVLEGD